MLLATAQRYIQNIKLMKIISDSINARFIGILQPILSQHNNILTTTVDKNDLKVKLISKFVQQVLDDMSSEVEYYDFTNIFDKYFQEIPVFKENEDLNSQIFIDNFHIFDPGNKIVAEEILRIVKYPKNKQ